MPFALHAVPLLALYLAPLGDERWRPPELLVRDRPPATNPDELRDLALSYLGRPYVMGGVGSPGLDCSGFTCRVYAEAGYAIPRVSRDQARAGRAVPLDALAPADLLFFSGEPGETRITHVGMYLGNGELVHAASGQGQVVVDRLGARWFRERLVSARRLLPDPGTSSTAPGWVQSSSVARPASVPALELVEHSGDDVLAPMLRRPARRTPPSHGPELHGAGQTELALRSAALTEEGRFGFTLAPEATLVIQEVALKLAVAVPIRFDLEDKPSLGRLERASDYTRFLRGAELGLRGADLELRLSRLGDATLLEGFLLSRLAPGSAAHGIPGLTTRERSALSFYGGYRRPELRAEVFADDVIGPQILGASFAAPVPGTPLRLGGALASDQHALTAQGRRALLGAQAGVGVDAIEGDGWYLGFDAELAGLRALGEQGLGARGLATLEKRFSWTRSLRLRLLGGWYGRRFASGLLGPTWVVEKERQLALLDAAGGRGVLGGEVELALGRLVLSAAYADGLGAERSRLDRELQLLLDLQALRLGSTRLLDLRVAYAARGFARGEHVMQTVHGGLRLRWASWLFTEVYVEQGQRLEGGAGLTLSWAP